MRSVLGTGPAHVAQACGSLLQGWRIEGAGGLPGGAGDRRLQSDPHHGQPTVSAGGQRANTSGRVGHRVPATAAGLGCLGGSSFGDESMCG